MATVEELTQLRTAAFQAARAIVEEWRSTSRRSTTAGVTSVLRQSGVLDLQTLGLSTNREFWELADESGLLTVTQQPNGHRLVLLPGETLADFVSTEDSKTTQTPAAETRLKNDVWTSFVDWNPVYRRFWDRDHSRAFMIPVAPGWGPSDDIDPARFVEIEPARHETQIGWMRDFSRTQPEPAQSALLSSLGEHAPRGAFRREVRERRLHLAWRAALRTHILDTAALWARSAGIELSSIIETRPRAAEYTATSSTPAPQHTPTGPPNRTAAAPENPRHSFDSHTAGKRTSHDDRTILLRGRLHRVIDSMTWTELADIPLRAEHLTDF